MAWVAGYNMPGYLPEMEPFLTRSWEDARDFLVEEIDREASRAAFEGMEGVPAALTDLRACSRVLRELRVLKPGTEWGDQIGDYAYWLSATDEEPDDEEEED